MENSNFLAPTKNRYGKTDLLLIILLLYGMIPEKGCGKLKIQHIQYALEIAQTGSISKAADRLLLSQPNISSALRTLESELGFAIFQRSNKGVTITPEGQRFLASARKIVEEYRQITQIKTNRKSHQFYLAAGYHSAIEEAFSRLCAECPPADRIDFLLTNTNAQEIIDRVYLNKSNLGILMLPAEDMGQFRSACDKRGLTRLNIQKLKFYVNLNRRHPLLQKPHFDFYRLRDYPFVDYGEKVLTTHMGLTHLDIIDPTKRILVGERDTRCYIVSLSNAFSISAGIHPRVSERYDWVNIPLPGIESQMTAVWRSDQRQSQEAKRYLALLQEEIVKVT